MLLDQLAALTFGHATPDAEFDLVVERVGEAFGRDGTIATDQGRSVLRRATHEKVVGISRATPRFRNPSEALLARRDS